MKKFQFSIDFLIFPSEYLLELPLNSFRDRAIFVLMNFETLLIRMQISEF